MPAEIVGQELMVIKDTGVNDRGNRTKIRVVRWIVDDEPKSIVLEKRNFFMYEEEGVEPVERMGKCEGFRLNDLKAIYPKLKEISEIMKNPPAHKSANEDIPDTVEECPF
ncbi:MAG: hypothetical protein NTY77_05465 [Elusimicrobia bacterium]|nr:hypothetical protein [Elusimicrobiota bacterium]